MTKRLDDAAADAARDPASIRRILNVSGAITDGASNGILSGPVDQWVEEITDLAITYGFDTFILWAEGENQLPKFAEQVVPVVRAQVAAERT
jgi:alkanesulfonate monooxygenase SsuD/methylene tetrahydromethanopterin reductase-like flavin-dependent oxidoreductase (luciferase family)